MVPQAKTRDGGDIMSVKSNSVGVTTCCEERNQCCWNEKGWERWLLKQHPSAA